FFTAHIDEEYLCPYCDLPLPLFPMEILVELLRLARLKSTPDPRPDNSLGLTATISVRAPVCSRHQFETDLLPGAMMRGWKVKLDLGDIERRLKSLHMVFQALVDDSQWVLGIGPRGSNPFWINAVASLSHGGGLGGNITNFKTIQPGYYGEQGVRVIHETFSRLFTIVDEAAFPLTPMQFLALVLIPEAGVQLIMEDMLVDRETARGIMHDSSSYGTQMFPDSDSS
ncbi:RTC4-like domain-containing protein, partial [Mycena polygramma]